MNPYLSLEEERELARKKEVLKKHKCRECIWSKWQDKHDPEKAVVSCLFPTRCVKEEGW